MKKYLMLMLALLLPLTAAACGAKQEGGADVTEGNAATLELSSFDGGGPEYDAFLADDDIASVSTERRYGREDHAEIDGAAYDCVVTVRGRKPGDTELFVSARSPIMEEWDRVYAVHVDETLTVTLTLRSETPIGTDPVLPANSCVLVLATPEHTYYTVPEPCAEAEALVSELSTGAVEAALEPADGGLSVLLPEPFACSPAALDAAPGDVLLLADGQTLLFCTADGTHEGVKLGTMDERYYSELPAEALPSVALWIEWSE